MRKVKHLLRARLHTVQQQTFPSKQKNLYRLDCSFDAQADKFVEQLLLHVKRLKQEDQKALEPKDPKQK